MPSVRPPTSTGASAGMRRAHRGRVLLLQQQQLVALRIGCVCWWILSMREAATALLLGMLRVSTRVGLQQHNAVFHQRWHGWAGGRGPRIKDDVGRRMH